MAKEKINNTGTELEILQKIESAWRRNNPEAQRRNTARSMDWFRSYVGRSFNRVGTARMFRDRNTWKNKMTMGKMYFFEYDPKHKDTLPVYDRYPLVFPFSAYRAKDGTPIIVGLNMHYLPPKLRLIAFKALLKSKNEKRFRKSTRLNIEWNIISKLAESRYFEHAVHAYRIDHVRSKFVEVPAQSWELALFLPLGRFVGDKSKLKI